MTFISRSSVAPHPPDETIVFTTLRPPNQDIYLVDHTDSKPRRMTDHLGLDNDPTFPSGGGGTGFHLFIQRLDGTDGRFLEPDLVGVPGRDMHPQFSPDGTWILFISGRSGINDEGLLASGPQPYGELWAIPVEGGSAIRLTHDKWEDGLARWGARQ